MVACENHIIVKVNSSQKEEINVGCNVLKTGSKYNDNFREKNPVVAEIVNGLGELKTGCFIVCNYNHFEEESPLRLSDDLFSIPVNEEIFAIVKEDGSLKPVCGNILVERVSKDSKLPLPEELKKSHNNQGIVIKNAEAYTKNQYIFWLPFSDYEIVYNWNGEEKRAIKIHKSEVVGYLK